MNPKQINMLRNFAEVDLIITIDQGSLILINTKQGKVEIIYSNPDFEIWTINRDPKCTYKGNFVETRDYIVSNLYTGLELK